MTTKTLTTLALITATFGCATTNSAKDLGDSGAQSEQATAEPSSDIEGYVLLKDGIERSLVSGLAVISVGDPRTDEDDELVVMLSTWEFDGCDIGEWYEHSGDDWNVIAIEVSGDDDPRIQVNQAYRSANGERAGSEGKYPRIANAVVDFADLRDLKPGQVLSGSVSTGDLEWSDFLNAIQDPILSIEADFTVQFCGSISDI
jgi:hypothetical protein